MSFSCSADWIDYGKSFCYACLSSGILQLQDSIVLVVSLLIAIMKDQVASFEEQFFDHNVALFSWQAVAVLRCIY